MKLPLIFMDLVLELGFTWLSFTKRPRLPSSMVPSSLQAFQNYCVETMMYYTQLAEKVLNNIRVYVAWCNRAALVH